ncbi:MAG: hypothetical protein ACI9JM_001287 [Halioglobus sp.]|jgi:hypothetical protein
MALSFLNFLFLLAFVLSAAVQYNDPDGLIWIALYSSAAAMCVAQQTEALPKWLPITLLVVSLLWAGALLPTILGQVSTEDITESLTMRTREIEEAREIAGLIIVALWSAVLALLSLRRAG